MICLDSIKIKTPIDCVEIEGLSNIGSNRKFDSISRNGILEKSILNEKEKPIGFKSATIDHMGNNLILELSAKILLDNYLKGICINTIEQMFYSINKYLGIVINLEQALNNSDILRTDVTVNVPFEMELFPELKNWMHSAFMNVNYQVTNYQKPNNKGLVVTGLYISKKDRIIFYDKGEEISRNTKANKTFARHVNDFPKLINQAKNIVRQEINLTTHKQMRSNFRTLNINLGSILASQQQVSYNYFMGLQKNDLSKINVLSGNEAEIRQAIGYKGVISQLNFNEGLIIAMLKTNYGTKNWDKYWHGRNGKKGYKQWLSEAKLEQLNPLNPGQDLLDIYTNNLKKVS
jgi:hypothetical protein